MKKNNRKLRHFFINFGIQRKIITIDIIFMILVMILTMVVMETQDLKRSLGYSAGVWHFAFGDIAMSLAAKLYILYGVILVTVFFAIGTQVWITHRVCGALVNFTNTFKEISNGNLDRRIFLRKEDMLKKEADYFNTMMEQLSGQINELKMENEKLRNESVA